MKKLKKSLCVLLSALMLISVFTAVPLTAGAATTGKISTSATSGDFSYRILDDGTAEITDFDGYGSTLEIPGELDGYTVTSIGESAFEFCDYLAEITIPDSVTSMGDSAFEGCTSLTSITIPDSVTYIGAYAFSDCGSLISITIPDGVTSIGDDAFEYCTSLASVTIGNGVTEIGWSAFGNCTSLTSITIGNSVTGIGAYAFSNCTSLKSITIPENVTSIGDDAFEYCTSLISITVDSNNQHYSSLDGNLYNKEQTELIQYAIGKTDEAFVIPDSVIRIGRRAFYGCASLEDILIPDSVTSIDWGAFDETPWYDNQPDGVVYAGKIAYGLKGVCPDEVVIKEGTLAVGDGAFSFIMYECSVSNVIIPDSVVSIGDDAFYYCGGLESITIGKGVKTIGSCAFAYCTSLESITIPDSVTSIGGGAFYNTAWYNNQPDGIVYTGKVAYEYKGEMPENTSIVLEDGTLGITDYAFSDCDNLTSITIPDSVTCIGEKALGYYYDYYDEDSYEDIYSKVDGFTIYGYTGTAAEAYATENGFEFVSLGEAPATNPSSATTPSESTAFTEPPTDEPTQAPTDEPTEPETSEPTEPGTQSNPTDNTESTAATEPVGTQPTTPIATEPTEVTKATQSATSAKPKTVVKKAKKANPMTVSVKTKTVKAKKLKKAKQTVKAITISKAKGVVTAKLIKTGTTKKIFKKITITKNGKITLKKGKCSKGTYKIKVKITAKGNNSYKSKSKTVTVRVKVK